MYILNKDLSLHYILNFIFTASVFLIFTTLICLLYDKWKTRKASSVTPGGGVIQVTHKSTNRDGSSRFVLQG